MTAAKILEQLWPGDQRSPLLVYAILDGARDERIQPLVAASELPHGCLYAGQLPRELVETAPYLVKLEKDAAFTRALLAEWGHSWGIFVLSTAPLEELRRHFRRFLKVEDARGKTLIFRYYDPRVLRSYLPTCNAGERETMFGPVSLYLLEGDDPKILIRYHRDRTALGTTHVPVG